MHTETHVAHALFTAALGASALWCAVPRSIPLQITIWVRYRPGCDPVCDAAVGAPEGGPEAEGGPESEGGPEPGAALEAALEAAPEPEAALEAAPEAVQLTLVDSDWIPTDAVEA